jgi:hypothetical protein
MLHWLRDWRYAALPDIWNQDWRTLMNYDQARTAQEEISNANERGRIGLIDKLRKVCGNLDQIAADLVSLKQKAENNAKNSSHQPPLPPMSETDEI